ncbi:hypothetical protein F4810DRAFT_94480 [Camillea tinctor]|nr:hypothetical protein F4810DRAFT_94480 [Camillea tinctor]
MCTYYYVHYHHIPPCAHTVEYAMHYTYCAHASSSTSDQQPNPCAVLAYDPASASPNVPCAAGEAGCCLMSQQCSSGECRLQDLGGRWTCCRCRRGGNTFRWCVHPMRRVPDTLCYHVVCQDCQADG